jgi:YVTN family beta-propeller protein
MTRAKFVLAFAFAVATGFSASELQAAGRNMYVVSQDAAVVSVIDTETDELTREVAVPKGPATLIVSRGGEQAFITHPELGVISVLSLSTLVVEKQIKIGGTPFGLALGQDDTLYVGDWNAHRVTAVSIATGEIKGSVEVGRAPGHLVSTKDGKQVFVANREADSVSVIDTGTFSVVATLNVGKAPFAIAASDDDREVYVAEAQSAGLSVIVRDGLSVSRTVKTGPMPYGVAIADQQDGIVIANQQGGTVSLLKRGLWALEWNVKVGRYPEGIAISAQGDKAYVANWFSSDISVIDLSMGKELKRLKCPDGPRSVVRGP